MPTAAASRKLCQMSDRCLHRQPLVGKLLFSSEVVVQSVTDAGKVGIDHRVTAQHPFLFCDVVLTDLTGVVEHPLEQSAVDGQPLSRGKLKTLFTQELCDPHGNDIRLLGVVLHLGALCAVLIVALDSFLGLVNGDITLNMLLGGIQQVFRGIQSVNRLQPDGSLPRLAFLNLSRLSPFDIFFKLKLPILFQHTNTSRMAA